MAEEGILLSERGREREGDYRGKVNYEKMKDKEYHGLAIFFLDRA
jgi:hypothetical protein